jgi:hypothetical protein
MTRLDMSPDQKGPASICCGTDWEGYLRKSDRHAGSQFMYTNVWLTLGCEKKVIVLARHGHVLPPIDIYSAVDRDKWMSATCQDTLPWSNSS